MRVFVKLSWQLEFTNRFSSIAFLLSGTIPHLRNPVVMSDIVNDSQDSLKSLVKFVLLQLIGFFQWSVASLTCCVNREQWVFKEWKTTTSNGWKMCVVRGAKQDICRKLFLHSSIDFMSRCDLSPSKINSFGPLKCKTFKKP